MCIRDRYIPGEEDKVERETQKILGQLTQNKVSPAKFPVSCTCTRVPITDGHTETVFVGTEKPVDLECLRKSYQEFSSAISHLPSAPQQLFAWHEDPFRPQPRIDRDSDGGMSTHLGRFRAEPVLGGVKYVMLSHNTKAGAAKGAILVAEYLVDRKIIN